MNFGRIRGIALDVDGVLTDGGFWWSSGGEELKRFSFRDVMGISIGKRAGIVFALVSGEDTPITDRFAEKLGIETVHKGCKDKAGAVASFAASNGFELSDVCFMGDDVNDLPAIRLAGLSAAPADAAAPVLAEVTFVSTQRGGHGAVRELIDAVIDAKAL